MTAHTSITPELIREALARIPANLQRDEWAKVAMAIKSEFPDATGFDLFDQWSASDPDRYDLKAVQSTWRSVKAGGGVGIGTLLHLAKDHGFTTTKSARPPETPSANELARRQHQRAQRRQAEQALIDEAHAAAAAQAAAQWQAGSESGSSPYLVRKGVKPHGVRFESGGTLLVPLRDGMGKLWNLQTIAPMKPQDGAPEKLFLKGGRKSGLWHLVGDVASDSEPPVVLVAEGYATAATLHEAIGHPVVVAFDAGNLGQVARALKKLWPSALLVLCGDDDRATEDRTGHNPGRDKANAAARAVRGLAVFPDGLPAGGSDFNDLHAHLGGLAGLEAVRSIVQRAIVAQSASQAATLGADVGKAKGKARQTPSGFAGYASGPALDRFHVDANGVWFTPPGDDGSAPLRVCGPLRVTGLARDVADNNAALLLEFDTPYKAGRRWLMPLAMLAGDGTAMRGALLSQGFMTPTDSKRRARLTEYLQSRTLADLVRHVPRVGWHGRCYVLPDETLGESAAGERVVFHSEAGIEARFSRRGTKDQWRRDLSRLCVGNSRFAFAVSAAFAGPLLAWAPGTTGGGFQFTGLTSIGKTTGFLIAASVWGKGTENDPESYIHKWRGTSNGFEYLGEQHNDATLILDEMGQVDAMEAGQVAYMLADGAGKSRSKAGGGLRQKPTWRTLFLSSGEVSLEQHMRTAGKVMKGGQEVRLIPIPAEVSPESSTETNHEFEGGHELSVWVKQRAALCYGAVGRAWLECLVEQTLGLPSRLRQRMEEIEALMVPEMAAGQVKRGGRRFALVAAAGEMATEAGLTGWPSGEATRAACACFKSWVQSRGGAGNSEVTAVLRQVRNFYELNGAARFTILHRGADDHAPDKGLRAGARRMLSSEGNSIESEADLQRAYSPSVASKQASEVEYEYLTFPEVFKSEVCKGFDVKFVARVLLEHGCLVTREKGRFTVKARMPGVSKSLWVYIISPQIFALDL